MKYIFFKVLTRLRPKLKSNQITAPYKRVTFGKYVGATDSKLWNNKKLFISIGISSVANCTKLIGTDIDSEKTPGSMGIIALSQMKKLNNKKSPPINNKRIGRPLKKKFCNTRDFLEVIIPKPLAP
jgi:hypothetical protein